MTSLHRRRTQWNQSGLALAAELAKRIVVIDGAMGSMIQPLGLDEAAFRGTRFGDHPKPLAGCNDLLVLTQPEAIEAIHYAYAKAGADIVETNTFSATSIAMEDYGLSHLVRELNVAAVQVARRAMDRATAEDGRPRWVAGAIGPTNKTASLSPDVNDPGFRAVTFAELVAAYRAQADALLDGGADLLLPETTFDTLNLKAALFAIDEAFEARGRAVPVIASVTITDRSGRTLSGQTLEAFYHAIAHHELLAVSLNCALGAPEMRPYVEELARLAHMPTMCYPNAGLPNEFGGYDDTPANMARVIREFADAGWLNMVGGCCGTTPAHIAAIAKAMEGVAPRVPAPPPTRLSLSGLEPVTLTPEAPFWMIGERTNVTGSAQFRRLIRDGNYEAAVAVARQQATSGANVLDVCMDEGMLDGEVAMRRFLNLVAAEPDIARLPIMIDSSKFAILEAGLACLQGKGVVNSISLKEGEAEFLRQARRIRRYGAAVVVMAFDETGQATTVAQRLVIAERIYRLLTVEVGFAAHDIIFDPNILTVGTGMEEHDAYAVEFLQAIAPIKARCPGMAISGGLSNLSFAFRTAPQVREAMHAVFLYHAIAAGMDMAIVNAGQLAVYTELAPELRTCVEDLVLNRRADATERLLALAATLGQTEAKREDVAAWRQLPLAQRLAHALIHGDAEHVDVDIAEAIAAYPSPLSIIEGPLMDGMNIVGVRFGEGKMFLPQVVKSARVMKKAVAILEPLMAAANQGRMASKGKLILATVKGDVHDIGKNIVAVVLRCNGYEIVDLGVMVPTKTILDTAEAEAATVIGLSGLITPSLDEMIGVAREMQRRGMQQTLLIGGATTSAKHTAVKLAPAYEGLVVHVADASLAVGVMGKVLGGEQAAYAREVQAKQAMMRERHAEAVRRPLLPLSEARTRRAKLAFTAQEVTAPPFVGMRNLTPDPREVAAWIDWSPLFHAWELSGRYPALLNDPKKGDEAKKLFADAQRLLAQLIADEALPLRATYGYLPAHAEDDDLVLAPVDAAPVRLPMLRQGEDKAECLSLADFVAPAGGVPDHVGLFVVTAGHASETVAARYAANHDDYNAIMVKALADRMAEATAEWLHAKVRAEWGTERDRVLTHDDIVAERYVGIRPAFGYPACPDHGPKRPLFALLGNQAHHGVTLTESFAMQPPSSVSGLYFAHPQASYFAVGRISREQLEDYAHRVGCSIAECERLLASNLGY